MKVVELPQSSKTLEELLTMASREPIILRQTEHKEFVLSAVDEFELEVELLRNNKEFMDYLDQQSETKATIPLEDVEKILEL